MRLRTTTIAIALFFAMSSSCIWAANQYIKSPDGRLTLNVGLTTSNKAVSCEVSDGLNKVSFAPSMLLSSGEMLGAGIKNPKYKHSTCNSTIDAILYKRAKVRDNYNALTMTCGNYSIEFRAYNDGVAYRFATARKGSITVMNESFDLDLNCDPYIYIAHANCSGELPIEEQFFNSFENTYVKDKLSNQSKTHLGMTPALAVFDNGNKLLISEANVDDYPGMFILPSSKAGEIKSVFAPYPKKEVQGGHNELQMLVPEREGFIARTTGTRTFPWRVMTLTTSDKQLTNTDMTYCLASPNRIADTSWIKPGKVAWDWWNDWNLKGVDFIAGVNNETYKYYIDFAHRNGISYVILDEGWAVNKKADMMQVVPEVNIPELVAYAKARNVDLILWAGYWALARDMENVVKHYSEMGIKGFKVDFFDRNDQKIVAFTKQLAELCAKHKMLVDLHGAFPPSGLQRTYPNIVNYEAVNGLEQLKWKEVGYDQVTFETELPFIRQVCGTMDYTQGAMRNATKLGYFPNYSNPMSQGTRCRQLAEYVIFESPLNMLCDSPSNYDNEPECTKYIAEIPTVWDETVAIDGKVGEYVVMARRKGNVWYIGGITNWTPRDITVDLSQFAGSGIDTITLYSDGVNTDKNAEDYKISTLFGQNRLTVHLASGGGFAAKIAAVKQ